MFGKFGVLLQIAFRNLFGSLINIFIGVAIFLGTAFIVVGGAMLDSLDTAMSKSIIGSIAGHIQVYSAESKDELSLWGQMGQESNLKPIDDFSKLEASLLKVPNVKAVVPMGISGAFVTSGNTIDVALSKLRKSENERRDRPDDAALERQIQAQKDLVQQMVTVLLQDSQKARVILTDKGVDPEEVAALETASKPEFWSAFDQKPFESLEFLENKIAPQAAEGDLLFIRYAGTNMDEFQKAFDRMEIVDGTAVPPGKRGFLFPKFIYEEAMKLKPARRLDKIHEGRAESGKTIAGDAELKRFVKENTSQTREIVLQLDALKTAEMAKRLAGYLRAEAPSEPAELPKKPTDEQKKEHDLALQRRAEKKALLAESNPALAPLLSHFMEMDDGNFDARYAFWNAQLAPMLDLYKVRVGDTLSIQAFGRSGYVSSVNVKVYGTFQFKGLEKSPLSGSLALMDLVSFRELYGFLSAEKQEEIKKLQAEAGLKEVSRDDAEAELFGGADSDSGKTVVADATPGVIDEAKELDGLTGKLQRKDLVERVYSPDELDKGVVLNSAVLLKDPTKLEQTAKDIEAQGARDGLKLKAVSWQKASGFLGQFILVLKIILLTVVFICFVVALAIINNAMMMATLRRVREIGTMRAIGAQRGFVLSMILAETVVLGLSFGLGGVLTGTALMKHWGNVGIPAFNQQLYFFFSGPRLYPTVTVGNLLVAFVVVLLVSAISTFYPAFLATRVQPVTAMQSEE